MARSRNPFLTMETQQWVKVSVIFDRF